MRNFAITLRIIMQVVPILILLSCGGGGKKYRIGVSQCSDDVWRSQMNEEIRREMLFHDNASVEIRSANDSNDRQIADIEYFIDNGFDIIIVAPNEAEALTPVVRKAYSEGIPVIVFDRTINDSTFTTYIELDNTGLGKNAARYASSLLKHSGGKNVVEITGLPGSSPAEERHSGFAGMMDSIGGMNIIGSFHADWKGDMAFAITDSLLQVFPDIDLIYAHNDIMAIAASEAVRKAGRSGISVIGTDGAPQLGIKAVADSIIDATFVYPTVGERVISAAIDILDGKPYPRVDHIPSVDYIDKSNASFHLRQNDLLRMKTDQIEMLNGRYALIRDNHATQRILLFVLIACALLLAAGVVGLLYFLRQKNHMQQSLLKMNAELKESNGKQAELYRQLEEATHAKLVFFTNISHDLLTPLVLITEPIRKIAAEPGLSAESRKLLDMMRRNAFILKRMIEQILDFRKYQNGKTSLRLEETDPLTLIRESAEMFRNLAEQKNIAFNVEVDKTAATMAVDTDKLERILFNLLTNALKYTPRGGEVKVECRMDSENLKLTVADNGPGIPPQAIDLIFDRYYRLDSSAAGGVGIGLALTKAFVELMGGEINVISREGEGTSFSVTIPVTHIDTAPQESDPVKREPAWEEAEESRLSLPASFPLVDLQPAEGNSKPLLLIIDDNEEIRRLIRIIAGNEFEVIEAADGKEGVRRAVKYVPDVIVCDIMMPGIDGLQTTEILKREKTTSHIPVLILTACRLDEQRVRSYDSGADAYISKPFTEEMLLSRLRNLIANRKRIYDLFSENSFSSMSARDREKTDPSLRLDNEFYEEFLKILRSRISDENLSVKDIASSLGIGATQLTRKIKAITGATPVEIIRELRLREGRRLLITTDKAVAEIAYSLGFSSPQYFARCFREKYGISPTDLRASIK